MVIITPPPLSSQSMADLLCTIMLLCRGRDSYGRDFWAYVCVKPSMAEAFKQARDSGALNLVDYGAILEAGEGIEVPRDIRLRMERDYGIRDDYEDRLLQAINAVKQRQQAN